MHSLPFSLELQKASKGVEGSKQSFKAFKNSALSRALTRGAFDLAGFFDSDAMQSARRRVDG